MTITIITKDGTKHVHTLISKFNSYEFLSLSEGLIKQLCLYGYNTYKYYDLKDISDIKFDFDAS